MAALFKQAVADMVAACPVEFAEFSKLKLEDSQFNVVGKVALRIVEETENRLCSKMEGGGKGKFSGTVAEKFRAEVKARFPLIDFVGVKFE